MEKHEMMEMMKDMLAETKANSKADKDEMMKKMKANRRADMEEMNANNRRMLAKMDDDSKVWREEIRAETEAIKAKTKAMREERMKANMDACMADI
jgi:hypothetical protein